MPKRITELSALAVSHINASGLHSVGGVQGLKLQVNSAKSRSWILRATVSGKVRDIGLGGYPEINLKTARELARDLKLKIARGIDPVEARK